MPEEPYNSKIESFINKKRNQSSVISGFKPSYSTPKADRFRVPNEKVSQESGNVNNTSNEDCVNIPRMRIA